MADELTQDLSQNEMSQEYENKENIKSSSKRRRIRKQNESEDDDEEETYVAQSPDKSKKKFDKSSFINEAAEEDSIIDDDDYDNYEEDDQSDSENKKNKILREELGEEEEEEEEELSESKKLTNEIEKTFENIISRDYDIPLPIHPGSTQEFTNEDDVKDQSEIYAERFLNWNQYGYVIKTLDYASNQSVIEILRQKLDGTTEKPKFQDLKNINLASLSNRGCVFARSGSIENENALIYYYDFNSWHNKKTWELNLSSKEQIRCITTSNDIVIVLTSGQRRYLRMFSPTGLQLLILQLRGEPISCTSRDSLVMIVTYDNTNIASQEQKFNFIIYDTTNFKLTLLTQGSFIPSPLSTIQWIGFSSSLIPIIKDSSGVIWCLSLCYHSVPTDTYTSQFDWIPLHDFDSNDDQFIVDIDDNYIYISNVRDNETQPRPSDKPILNKIKICMPLLNINSKNVDNQSNMEELRLRKSIKYNQSNLMLHKTMLCLLPSNDSYQAKEQNIPIDEIVLDIIDLAKSETDKAALKLFQKTVKSDHLLKAYDVACLLVNKESIEAAAAYAQHSNKPRLYEKIVALLEKMATE